MKSKRYLLFVMGVLSLCSVIATGCGRHRDSSSYAFMPSPIPAFVVGGEARMSYMGLHFWDNYDFRDASFIRSREGQAALCNYVDLLLRLSPEEGVSDIGDMMQKARADSATCMEVFAGAEKILYDPNSPLRNETLYMEVLRKMLAWQRLDETSKSRPRFQYRLAQKNRPGHRALNFIYTLRDGRQGSLYDLRSEYVLLYINNPGCGDCERVQKQLEDNSAIGRLTARKRLTILSIYPDEDLAEWKKNEPNMPRSWAVAYDKGAVMKRQNLYDLRAIPTLYLLDKDKRVLLKDARFEEITSYIEDKILFIGDK